MNYKVGIPENYRNITNDILFSYQKGKAKKILYSYFWFLLFMGLGLLPLLGIYVYHKQINQYMIFGLIFFLIFAMGGYQYKSNYLKKYSLSLKNQLFQDVLFKLVPSINYSSTYNINLKSIKKSELFETIGWYGDRINRISYEDYFFGKRGNTSFCFSEISAKYVEDREVDKTIFKGLYFKIELKNISDNIYIYSKNSKKQITNVKEHKFEFCIEGDIKTNNFKILSDKEKPDLINSYHLSNLLLRIENTFGNETYIHLKNRFCYIGITTYRDYFEPNLSENLTFNQVDKIYGDIINCLMIVDIIDELNHGTPNPNLKQIDE